MSKQKARGAYITRRIKTLSKKLEVYGAVWEQGQDLVPLYLTGLTRLRLHKNLPTKPASKCTRITVGDAIVEVFEYYVGGMWAFRVGEKVEDAGNTTNGREALMEGLRALVEHLKYVEEDAARRLAGVETKTWFAHGGSPWKALKR